MLTPSAEERVMGSTAGPAGVRSVPPATLSWLEDELAAWQAEGRLDAAAAAGIRARYTASRRLSLGRLMLLLGAAFLGVGLIWLVATNLDELSPAVRFGGVLTVWLAALVAGELLAERRSTGSGPTRRDPAVGGLRLLAALAWGGVVFQAAQSLQVPAYASSLLGVWAAGALLQAYATRALAPLVVGITAGVGWYLWAVGEHSSSVDGVATSMLLAGALASALAAAHAAASRDPDGLRRFAGPWRVAGALLLLAGLFLAALPRFDPRDTGTSGWVWAGAAAVLLAAAAAGWAGDRLGRLEAGGAVAVLLLGVLVLRWQPDDRFDPSDLSGEALARAVVAVLVYLLAALAVAALGTVRGLDGLTHVATAALVIFTVVQSFAIFQSILSGATLFLALGAVLAVSGFLVDRGRRRLVDNVREVEA
jgi:uncharacterized membrane protein